MSAPRKTPDLIRPGVPDRSGFRKKLLLRLFSSPLTLLPVLAGVTDLLVLWTFGLRSGMGIFVGIAGILGGVGIFLTRLLLDGSVGKETIEAMAREMEEERERALDDMDRRLAADGDPRTKRSMRDLRELARVYRQGLPCSESLQSSATFDILSGVEQLFNRCVLSLEKTLDLWYTARRMSTREARKPILDQRERIIEEIGESVKQLGTILGGIQDLGTGEGTGESDLTRLREELNRNLEVARRVTRRMEDLSKDIDFGRTE
jgi:hypothetical protein